MPTISIYLRDRELELLDRIGEALGKNRSETIQYMLKQLKDWIEIFAAVNPELLKLKVKDILESFGEGSHE